ncbi:DUF5060 domain-containing protein [Brumimicrobium aurantiacum]|uniref:DUF5060 domain-containing protein n=1 Tax=Brumimicrobium aurantiacum TaxID=1737063 RepID=A0A3E1EVJ8_9FLAO|nr:DUF5060 domain-containing protein [Brumimicrobium aurantiacum]RFC53579.1 DUF5060 domain-containing protein [Brumimicrobium aurantiacum]
MKVYFLLFFSLFLTALVIGQDNQLKTIDFKFMNQDQSKVAQNSRLELGVELPDSVLQMIRRYMAGRPNQRGGLNPFVSWDIDVKAIFMHKESGEKSESVGFWYHEMERNENANRWNYLQTDYQFRIRFAPEHIGEWSVKVFVKLQGEQVYISKRKSFNVFDSKYKGFVSLNERTQYLERDGRTIIPTGVNLPFPSNENNLMYDLDKTSTLDIAAWEEYETLVKDYVGKGGEYFRMLFHPSANDIEFEEVGYYQGRQNFAWEMDNIVAFCEENNALIQLNLMYHTYFMKLGDYHQFRYDFANHWYDENIWPYKDPSSPSGYSIILNSDTPSDMFLEELGMRYLKQKTRYIMARWGYSTSISMVELLCEPWHIDENPYADDRPYDEISETGDKARKAVYEYHKQISSYIKDSLNYNNHLLAAVGRNPSGKSAIYSHYTKEQPEFVDSTWFLEDIDVISISFYSRSPEKTIHSKKSSNNKFQNENSIAATINRLKEVYGKPVLFGESDHGDGTHMCSDYQGHKIDVMRYPFTGSIGHYIWAAFMKSDEVDPLPKSRDESESWPVIIETKDYFNSDRFISLINDKELLGRERAKFKGSDKYLVEHQYIIGDEKSKVEGYVYNRTFNVQTASASNDPSLENKCNTLPEGYVTPTEISWRPNRMKIEGLKPLTKYSIFFFGYANHSLLIQADLRTSLLGKLKLTHPLLVPNQQGAPLLWYQVERAN